MSKIWVFILIFFQVTEEVDQGQGHPEEGQEKGTDLGQNPQGTSEYRCCMYMYNFSVKEHSDQNIPFFVSEKNYFKHVNVFSKFAWLCFRDVYSISEDMVNITVCYNLIQQFQGQERQRATWGILIKADEFSGNYLSEASCQWYSTSSQVHVTKVVRRKAQCIATITKNSHHSRSWAKHLFLKERPCH